MSIRVGHILRHEDVHGVSGEGIVAEVVEFSNGKVVITWLSPTPSVNVYDSFKAAEVPHRHGGKTEIVWIWEQEPDPDPMDKVIQKKVAEVTGKDPAEAAEVLTKATDEMADGIVKDVLNSAVKKLSEMAENSSREGPEEGKEDSPPTLKKESAKKPTASKKVLPKKGENKKGKS